MLKQDDLLTWLNKLKRGSKRAFDITSVSAVQRKHGVYAIYEGRRLIYIGCAHRPTGSLRQRLTTHLNGPNGVVGPGDAFRDKLAVARRLLPPSEPRWAHRKDQHRSKMDRYVRNHCTFSFLVVEPGESALLFEGFARAILNPELNGWPQKTEISIR